MPAVHYNGGTETALALDEMQQAAGLGKGRGTLDSPVQRHLLVQGVRQVRPLHLHRHLIRTPLQGLTDVDLQEGRACRVEAEGCRHQGPAKVLREARKPAEVP